LLPRLIPPPRRASGGGKQPLASYPRKRRDSNRQKLEAVTNPRLFATPYGTGQPKLFALDALGEGGWLKALKLAGYAARSRRRPEALQQTLFSYLEAL
jgi:hypothetical protein